MKRIFAALCAVLLCIHPFSLFASEIEPALSHGSRSEKKIALTFDDGPHPRYTQEILDLLEQYNIKATFFMIGSNVKLYPETAKKVHNAGHEIGNHTFHHPHMLQLSQKRLLTELEETEKALSENGIPKTRLFRPPEGYRTPTQCIDIKNAGYTIVVWSLDTHDWKSTPSCDIVRYVTTRVQGGDILLFHDYISGQNTTIAALKELIPQLLQSGYQFVTVSELMPQASCVSFPISAVSSKSSDAKLSGSSSGCS